MGTVTGGLVWATSVVTVLFPFLGRAKKWAVSRLVPAGTGLVCTGHICLTPPSCFLGASCLQVPLPDGGTLVCVQFSAVSSFFFFKIGCHCIAQAGLKLMVILLDQPPEGCNYRHVPSSLANFI